MKLVRKQRGFLSKVKSMRIGLGDGVEVVVVRLHYATKNDSLLNGSIRKQTLG